MMTRQYPMRLALLTGLVLGTTTQHLHATQANTNITEQGFGFDGNTPNYLQGYTVVSGGTAIPHQDAASAILAMEMALRLQLIFRAVDTKNKSVNEKNLKSFYSRSRQIAALYQANTPNNAPIADVASIINATPGQGIEYYKQNLVPIPGPSFSVTNTNHSWDTIVNTIIDKCTKNTPNNLPYEYPCVITFKNDQSQPLFSMGLHTLFPYSDKAIMGAQEQTHIVLLDAHDIPAHNIQGPYMINFNNNNANHVVAHLNERYPWNDTQTYKTVDLTFLTLNGGLRRMPTFKQSDIQNFTPPPIVIQQNNNNDNDNTGANSNDDNDNDNQTNNNNTDLNQNNNNNDNNTNTDNDNNDSKTNTDNDNNNNDNQTNNNDNIDLNQNNNDNDRKTNTDNDNNDNDNDNQTNNNNNTDLNQNNNNTNNDNTINRQQGNNSNNIPLIVGGTFIVASIVYLFLSQTTSQSKQRTPTKKGAKQTKTSRASAPQRKRRPQKPKVAPTS